MKVLVIGGGGREHALVWSIRQSSRVQEVVCAPGNGGIATLARCVPVDQNETGRSGSGRGCGAAGSDRSRPGNSAKSGAGG